MQLLQWLVRHLWRRHPWRARQERYIWHTQSLLASSLCLSCCAHQLSLCVYWLLLLLLCHCLQVRCQASGLPVRGVVKQLLASPRTAVGQLYAGVVGASIASVAVGEWLAAAFPVRFNLTNRVHSIEPSTLCLWWSCSLQLLCAMVAAGSVRL